MSHPNPNFDPENALPEDNYDKDANIPSGHFKPKKKHKDKKSDMAKKMFKAHGSVMSTILKGLKKKKKPGYGDVGQNKRGTDEYDDRLDEKSPYA